MGKACEPPRSSICHNRKFRELVSQYGLPGRLTVTLKVAAVVHQIVTGLDDAVSERHKIIIFIKMVLNLVKRNVC
jgi:hypothetical protein